MMRFSVRTRFHHVCWLTRREADRLLGACERRGIWASILLQDVGR